MLLLKVSYIDWVRVILFLTVMVYRLGERGVTLDGEVHRLGQKILLLTVRYIDWVRGSYS